MTNAEKLLNALNEIDDRYLLEVDKRISAVKTRRRATWSSIAAVFVIFIGSFAFMISNMSWGNAGYSIYGEFGGGYFYYEIPYKGIYRYTVGGESELIVKVKRAQYYEFTANDIGLYYAPDNYSIYTIPHDSDEASLFFEDKELNFFNMYKYDSEDLLLSLNYSNDKIYHEKEVIVDGKTGEEKRVAFEEKSYYKSDVIEKLEEQGYSYKQALEKAYTIISSTGERTFEYYEKPPEQGNDEYRLRIDYNDNLTYFNKETGQKGVLLHEEYLSSKDMFGDGKNVYISSHDFTDRGKEIHTIECYEIIFDESGTPTYLKLIDENIIE